MVVWGILLSISFPFESFLWLLRGLSCKPNIYVYWSTSELRVRMVHCLTGLSPPVKHFYWSFQGDASFVDHLCYFCLVLLCFHAHLFVDALWSPAGNGQISWLSFVMSYFDVVTFPIGILGQVWCLIVSLPDLCPLSYFYIFPLLLLMCCLNCTLCAYSL